MKVSTRSPYHCPACGHTFDVTTLTVYGLNQRIAALQEELLKTRLEVKPYLEVLVECQRRFPNGYTIVDFQLVWLEQERNKSRRLEAELAKARREIGAILHIIQRHQPPGSPCPGDLQCLVEWIMSTIVEERDQLRAEVEQLRTKNERGGNFETVP